MKKYNQKLFEAFRDVTLHSLHCHNTLVISNASDNTEVERISYDTNDNYISIKNNVYTNLTYDEVSTKLNIILQQQDKFKSELI